MLDNISISEIIKKSFKSVVRDPKYVILYLLPISVIALFNIFIYFTLSDIKDSSSLFTFYRENIVLLSSFFIIYLFVYLIFYCISTAGLIKKVQIQEKKEYMGIKKALSHGVKIFPKLFTSMILGYSIIVSPFIILFIVFIFSMLNSMFTLAGISLIFIITIGIIWIYIYIRLSLFPFACVVEDKWPISSLKKSWYVTQGNVFLVFFVFLSIFLIYLFFSIPSIILPLIGISQIFSIIYISLIYLFLMPFFSIIMTLLYLNLSGKKDSTNSFSKKINSKKSTFFLALIVFVVFIVGTIFGFFISSYINKLNSEIEFEDYEDILKNGDFENYSYWKKAIIPKENLTLEFDQKIKHSGNISVSINNSYEYNRSTFNNWRQNIVNIPYFKEIELSCWIKAEDAEFIELMIECLDENYNYTNCALTRYEHNISGTFDWKLYKISVSYVPPNTKLITVGLGLIGTGKVWFDDAKLIVK